MMFVVAGAGAVRASQCVACVRACVRACACMCMCVCVLQLQVACLLAARLLTL